MRELFNKDGGHGAASSLEDMASHLQALRDRKTGPVEKLNLHNFGYLFEDLSRDAGSRLPECGETIAALKTLGSGMADPQPQAGPDSDVPAGYTYLGQFIDHDITRDAQAGKLNDAIRHDNFEPVTADEARHLIKNVRTATLELDSVYAGGPLEDPDLYESDRVRFKLGRNRKDSQGVPQHIDSATNNRDILRQADGTPIIGDQRNDENLLIAQTHHAFKQFHNQIAEQLKGSSSQRFHTAQKKVIQHYQWIVLHDFLPRIVGRTAHRNALYDSRFYSDDKLTFMPFEFSAAAFRFGHSMVRQRYQHNSIFGKDAADFALMFDFTNGGSRQMPLPNSAIIDWSNFYQFDGPPANFARPIDTRLSTELERLPNESGLMRMLAIRNLLRGYLMSLPTGQAVAERIGAKPLSNAELLINSSSNERNALRSSALSAKTPLWYYILKESAVREQGRRLGETGSTIVAETLVALIKRSKHSILQEANWRPDLADETGRFTMSELLTICNFDEALPAFA